MNRGKKPLAKTIKKKIQKSIRKNLQSGEDTVEPVKKVLPSTKDLLKGQPKKKAKIVKDHLASMEASAKAKKQKAKKKLSKRTSPSDAIVESIPAHVHTEGTRWIKTLNKQTSTKNKIALKKDAKRK